METRRSPQREHGRRVFIVVQRRPSRRSGFAAGEMRRKGTAAAPAARRRRPGGETEPPLHHPDRPPARFPATGPRTHELPSRARYRRKSADFLRGGATFCAEKPIVPAVCSRSDKRAGCARGRCCTRSRSAGSAMRPRRSVRSSAVVRGAMRRRRGSAAACSTTAASASRRGSTSTSSSSRAARRRRRARPQPRQELRLSRLRARRLCLHRLGHARARRYGTPVRYAALNDTGGDYGSRGRTARAGSAIDTATPTRGCHRHATEFKAAFILAALPALGRPGLPAARDALRPPARQRRARTFVRFFGCPVAFGAEATEMLLDRPPSSAAGQAAPTATCWR